jgi:hypothetical protein
MTDILTENDFSLKKTTAVFSKTAFVFSILTFLLFLIFVANITALFRVRTNNPAILGLIIILLLLSMTLGLIFSIISLVKKERIKYIKGIAAIVNIGLIIVIIGTMIFALIMDLKNMSR